jgi:regulator of protease activity HflC (stomatin/prohibitin superfamily)
MKEFWKDYGKIAIVALVVIIVIGVAIDIFNPAYGWCATVPAGHVGVVEHFGQVRESTLQPGFHMTGFFEHVHPVDIRTQRHNYQTECFSSDIQQVDLSIAVNENISPDAAYKLYTTVGMNYLENLLEPRLLENTKVVISKYTAESLIANREKLSAEVLVKMQENMAQYGINVTAISIENIDFTDQYEAAIEAKQVATQEKQRAQTEQDRMTMETEQAAKRKKIEADAAAEVQKIEADADAYAIKAKAEAEAEANDKINKSLTDALISYVQMNKWNGALPQFVGGDSTIPVLDFTGAE